MDQLLFDRSTGALGPNVFAKHELTRLLRSFRPATQFQFDGDHQKSSSGTKNTTSLAHGDVKPKEDLRAHEAGVNAMALERFYGKILVSGGADGTIKLWDLEQCGNPHKQHTYQAGAHIPRSDSTFKGHKFGITNLSFIPADSGAFLSSSYDQTVKIWDTNAAQLAGTWDLNSKVYTHAISPIADHLLVACGLAHPAVRLIDLRSNSATQSLVAPNQIASSGAVLSLAWSPRHEHVLASGTLDGAVRIWDIRRASGLLGLLDQEDSRGIEARESGDSSTNEPLRRRGVRTSAKAHAGPVNALTWSDDGAYLVTGGHDRRIRVWDAATGANTLASFGPSIRNGQLANVPMFVTPMGLMPPRKELLFWPNETEILVMELHEGTTVTRLRGPGAQQIAGGGGRRRNRTQGRAGGQGDRQGRITSVVWRGAGGYAGVGSIGVVAGGSNAVAGVYSGSLDGQIRAWIPKEPGDDAEDVVVEDPDRVETGQKRKAIDDAFRNLMGTGISFT